MKFVISSNGGRIILLAASVSLLCSLSLLAAKEQHPTKGRGRASATEALLRRDAADLWQAYSTGDLAGARKFYAPGPELVFFDVAPLEYHGIDEYQVGVKQLLSQYRSLSLRLDNDLQIHPEGRFAWGTATFEFNAVHVTGNKTGFLGRWTVIWEQRDNTWKIVHEHVSAPLGAGVQREMQPERQR